MPLKTQVVPPTQRGRRTREKLVSAARGVFEQQGFLEARIIDITNSAQVAQGTFYTYFDSKEEIFAEVARAFSDEVYQATIQETDRSDDVLERIETANRLFVQAYQRGRAMFAVIEQMAPLNAECAQIRRDMRLAFVRRAENGIMRLQEQGLADPALDAHYAANALGSMVDNFAYVWLVLGEPFDEELAIATLTRLWAQGIGVQIDKALRHS